MDFVSDARAIYVAAVRAVQADRVLLPVQWSALLGDAEHVTVVGAGKAAMAMAGTAEPFLGEALSEGFVIVPHGYADTLPATQRRPERIEVVEAGHPVPDAGGQEAADRVLRMAAALDEGDLLLVLLSGGGSALWPAPAEGISLDDLQELNEKLLASGASIEEVNAVRKHVSRIKGGRLAVAAQPTRVATLLISDVVGDSISVIASGPTAPDTSTFAEAADILRRYEIWDRLAEPIQSRIEAGIRGDVPETPKPGANIFERVEHHILATNRTALAAARREAERRGYQARIIEEGVTGEARKVGRRLADELEAVGLGERPVCLLWGGETTVTVSGSGKGGRNQEVALAAGLRLEGAEREIILLSAGTDGIDGPTDAAGAWVTPQTVAEERAHGLNAESFLEDNDSYTFFKHAETLIRTGPTHTNVMDIHVGLVAS